MGSSLIATIQPVNTRLSASLTTYPATDRSLRIKDTARLNRPHAVCVVQTFRNAQTGPMLFMFALYWLKLGWRVIIYDRFGMHREFVESILTLAGLDYHPYTVFELAQPSVYNKEYYAHLKEKLQGHTGSKTDTYNQDHDKFRSYDFARVVRSPILMTIRSD
jgi:hypothetical protein